MSVYLTEDIYGDFSLGSAANQMRDDVYEAVGRSYAEWKNRGGFIGMLEGTIATCAGKILENAEVLGSRFQTGVEDIANFYTSGKIFDFGGEHDPYKPVITTHEP